MDHGQSGSGESANNDGGAAAAAAARLDHYLRRENNIDDSAGPPPALWNFEATSGRPATAASAYVDRLAYRGQPPAYALAEGLTSASGSNPAPEHQFDSAFQFYDSYSFYNQNNSQAQQNTTAGRGGNGDQQESFLDSLGLHQPPQYFATDGGLGDHSGQQGGVQALHQLQAASVPAGALQWEAHMEAQRAEKIWNTYLYGQSANVAKAAVWWSMFGTLVVSLMGTDAAVGSTRSAFNLALVVVSPLAGAVAERSSIRTLLNLTTCGRMMIWAVLAPAAWILLNNVLGLQHVYWGVFVFLMFVDGIQVAFANVVDIDCGGLETLSDQYSLPVNDYIRNRFNSIHQMVFDLSFILFTPPVAFLLLELSRLLPRVGGVNSWLGDEPSVTALQIGISFVFLVLSLLSLWWYMTGLPKISEPSTPHRGGGGTPTAAYGDEIASMPRSSPASISAVREESKSVFWETMERMKDVADGLSIVLRERALGWRLVFLALETALEDSMVSVIIPEVALHTSRIFAQEHDNSVANLWAVCIIAIGKIGGLLSGLYMSTRWNPPMHHQRNSPYRVLFWSVLLSSLSISLFPIGRYLSDQGLVEPPIAGTLVFLASFLFFVFSTAPKIGFATLLQSLVASQQVAGRVFGFVGTFVTIADAIVITFINMIFVYFGPEGQLKALVCVAALYIAHGLLEALAGPILILDPAPSSSTSRSLFFSNDGSQAFPMANVVTPGDGSSADSGADTLRDRHVMGGIDRRRMDDLGLVTGGHGLVLEDEQGRRFDGVPPPGPGGSAAAVR